MVKCMAVKTDIENFDLTQIPLEAEKRIGKIFREGEVKYDRNNWRKGINNKEYQLERANHALKHLKIYIHQLEFDEYIGEIKDGVPEDDLAKVGWFVATACELERLEAVTMPELIKIEEETAAFEPNTYVAPDPKPSRIGILRNLITGN